MSARPLVVVTAALALVAGGCSTAKQTVEETDAPFAAGVTSLSLTDPGRGRVYPAELFYPAPAGTTESLELYKVVFPVRAARDAPLSRSPHPNGKFPLVLVSHGSGGTRHDLAWMATRLAREGYLAIAIEHVGNSFGTFEPFWTLRVWERPRDQSAALDAMLAHPRFGPVVDTDRIGAIGHSLGGYTVMGLAGARYDIDIARASCKPEDRSNICDLVPKVDYSRIDYSDSRESVKDARVRAVVAYAPAVGGAIDERGAQDVDIPALIFVGDADKIAEPRFHAERWSAFTGAPLVVVEGGDHYVFITPCNVLGDVAVTVDACHDSGGVDRVRAQRWVAARTQAFLDEHLAPLD